MTPSQEDTFLSELNLNTGIIRRVCGVYFSDTDDRKDAYQEIVYQAWKSYPTFKGGSKFSTWLYRVAINTALTFARKGKRFKTVELPEDLQVAEPEIEDERQLRELYAAIYSLSYIDRAIMLLHLDELDYEEIAVVTGLSKTNVSVRLVRMKKKIIETVTI